MSNTTSGTRTKRTSSLIVAGLATGGIVLASTSALAWRDGGNRAERMIERVSERLELDDNQLAALESLAIEMRETRELVRGDGGELRQSVRDLVTADTLDQGAALALIERRTSAVQTQAPALVAAAAVFLDGLSPEQKGDIEAFLDRMGRRHDRD